MLVLGSDGKSLRVFSRDMEERLSTFFRPTDAGASDPYTLVDSEYVGQMELSKVARFPATRQDSASSGSRS